MKLNKSWKSCAALMACLFMMPALQSCVEKESAHHTGVHAFVVQIIPENGFGTVDAPLKYSTTYKTLYICKDGEENCVSGLRCPEGESCNNIAVGAYAVDIEGNFVSDYNGTVSLSAEPGKMSKQTLTFKNGMVGLWADKNDTILLDGVMGDGPQKLLKGEDVGIRYAFGKSRLWLEDNLTVNEFGLPQNPTLSTGVSAELVFEPQTIRMIQYNPEQKDADSPLIKEYGQLKALKGHHLVVTNVVSTGFYISDIGDGDNADSDYNSLFIFTYSQPARVEIGDRVCEVSGGIAEFTGMTQLQFPSWGIQNKERSTAEDTDPAPEDGDQGVGSCIDKETGLSRPCTDEEIAAMQALVDCSDVYFDRPLTKEEKKAFAYIEPPAPKVISPELLAMKTDTSKSTGPDGSSIKTNPAQTTAIERLESSVVTIQGIRLSTEFINCDDNGNGKIESNTAEAECRTKCQENSKRCTELSNLESYDQWKAWTVDGNAEVSVASSSLIANFDITSDCISWIDPSTNRHVMRCPERRMLRLTGNLKQILPGCSGDSLCYASKWKPSMVMSVIEPRVSTDLIMDEVYNAGAKIEFDKCVNDKRAGGCWDACVEYAGACTCADFKNYRDTYPPTDPSIPTRCQ